MSGKAKIRRADFAELRIFYGWMGKQFHPGELKSLVHINNMCRRGRYSAYGLWDGDELIAYALLGNTADGRKHLLDYYAVLPQYQDQGWGSRFLGMLREALKGDAILLEVEDPDYAPDEAERAHWQRRIRFYEKNDCRHTGVKLNLYGFDYTLMQLPQKMCLSDGEVRRAMEEIYHTFSPPKMYEENVRFREPDRIWMFEGCAVQRSCTSRNAPVLYLYESPGKETVKKITALGWTLVWITVDDWNRDLTPWPAKAVFFGQRDFGGGAREHLRLLQEKIMPTVEEDLQPPMRAIAGYSLAGLFAIFAAMETNLFDAVASVSGSMWYSGFADYVEQMEGAPRLAYFSVGYKEKMTKNTAFHSIEEDTKRIVKAFDSRGAVTAFEFNPGGHFDNFEGRMKRAYQWLDENLKVKT